MLQLICHHTYDTWSGLPVDRSAYGRSNGFTIRATHLADGATPGSGALRFQRRSLVSVGPGDAWQDLGALKIEVVARLDGFPVTGPSRFFVIGDGSFSLETRGLTEFAGKLKGVFGVIMRPGGGQPAIVSSGSAHAPDGHAHTTPLDRWATIGFSYDGFSTMQLTIDDVLVGRVSTTVPLLPVGPEGVSIGATREGENPLLGEIDEIKIWRRDPDALKGEFLCRPYDERLANCWLAVFRAIGTAFQQHPTEMRTIAQTIQDLMKAQLRAAARTGPGALSALQDILRRYVYLWCQGAVDTDAMEGVFRDFFRWWRDHTEGDPPFGGKEEAIRERLVELVGPVQLDCDPAVQALGSRILAASNAR